MKHTPFNRSLAALALSAALAAPAAQASVQVEGVHFEPEHALGGVTLDLEGAAVFRYLLFKVYAAALYLPDATAETDVLADDVARRLEVVYFRDIAGSDLARAADTILQRAVPPAEFAGLQERIEQLHGWYRDVTAGDRIALSYVPGQGTTLEMNGRALGTVPGADFARAYFAIWLGEMPIDEELREALLAQRDDPAAAPRKAGTATLR